MKKIINTLFLVFLSAFLPMHFSISARTPQEIVDVLLAKENQEKKAAEIISVQDQSKDIANAVEILRKRLEKETFERLQNGAKQADSMRSLVVERLSQVEDISNGEFLKNAFPKNFYELLSQAFKYFFDTRDSWTQEVVNTKHREMGALYNDWAAVDIDQSLDAFMKIIGSIPHENAVYIVKNITKANIKASTFFDYVRKYGSERILKVYDEVGVASKLLPNIFASKNVPESVDLETIETLFSCKTIQLPKNIAESDFDKRMHYLIHGLKSRPDSGMGLIKGVEKSDSLCNKGAVWWALYQERAHKGVLALFDKITEFAQPFIIEKCKELILRSESLKAQQSRSGSEQDEVDRLDAFLKHVSGTAVYKEAYKEAYKEKAKDEKLQKFKNGPWYKMLEEIAQRGSSFYFYELFDERETRAKEKIHKYFGPFEHLADLSYLLKNLSLEELSEVEKVTEEFVTAVKRVDAVLKKKEQERESALQRLKESEAYQGFNSNIHRYEPAFFTDKLLADLKKFFGEQYWKYEAELPKKTPQELKAIENLLAECVTTLNAKATALQQLKDSNEYKEFNAFIEKNNNFSIQKEDISFFTPQEQAAFEELIGLSRNYDSSFFERRLLNNLPEKGEHIKNLMKGFVVGRTSIKKKEEAAKENQIEEEKRARDELLKSDTWIEFNNLITKKLSFNEDEKKSLEALRTLTGQTDNKWLFPAWMVQNGNHTVHQLKEIKEQMQNFVDVFKKNGGWQRSNPLLRGERSGDETRDGFLYRGPENDITPLLVRAAAVATPVIAYKVVQYVRHKLAIRKAVQQIKELRARLPKGRKLTAKEYAEYVAKKQEIITSLGLEKYVEEINKHFAPVAG